MELVRTPMIMSKLLLKIIRRLHQHLINNQMHPKTVQRKPFIWHHPFRLKVRMRSILGIRRNHKRKMLMASLSLIFQLSQGQQLIKGRRTREIVRSPNNPSLNQYMELEPQTIIQISRT